ncbi:hypothetical protein GQ457_15G026610 [Hibiscus cannabinus]
MFGSILWNLWGSRNRRIFDPDAIDGGNVFERSRQLAMEATRAIESKHLSHRSNSSVRQSSVRRNPPRNGVWKLNVDGARNLPDGSASCGGVIRDSHGTWIAGFSKYIGKCSALEAEFWAVYKGLVCAQRLNAESIVVESDNLNVVHALQNSGGKRPHSSLFDSICGLLWHKLNVAFCHIVREGNSVADAMTRLSHHHSFDARIYLYPPDEVLNILLFSSVRVRDVFNEAYDETFPLL